MDWRDIDDVSVLLLLSTIAPVIGLCNNGCVDGVPEPDGFTLPVISSLLKASTSSEALVNPESVLSAGGRSYRDCRCNGAAFAEGSKVASVLWKGFNGTAVVGGA